MNSFFFHNRTRHGHMHRQGFNINPSITIIDENRPKFINIRPILGNIINKNKMESKIKNKSENKIENKIENKNENKIIHHRLKTDGWGGFPNVVCRFKYTVCDNLIIVKNVNKYCLKSMEHPLFKIETPKMKVNIIKKQFK